MVDLMDAMMICLMVGLMVENGWPDD
jgi:hypothetical protein